MASDKGVYEAANEIRCELSAMREALCNTLDELSAAAEAPTAHQLYTAHILGGLVSTIRTPSDVNQLAEEAIQERLCALAYNLANRMFRYELDRQKAATKVDRNGTGG
jgi:hypothetical protein